MTVNISKNATTHTPPVVKSPNILIDTMRISGFRGISNLEITFDLMTVLIGPNNSGKTTILKALSLALGNYGRYVVEEDFHLGADDNGDETRASEIIVDVRIVSTSNNGIFDDEWLAEFGDKIKSEASGKQYVAIRTQALPNIVGGFSIERHTMEKWPDYSSWMSDTGKLTKAALKIESIPFFSIEAQRDIHSELKDKTSFVGKVLSGVEYDKDVIASLESAIENINKDAVSKSNDLQCLKNHLTQLNQTFLGGGNAEITPLPKKVRDLSKNFSVHFGETTNNMFAMEYHGMGTRSWASVLTARALMDTMRTKHEDEVAPFFPILATEEPEAHLHPNAQKTLYNQLVATNAQVIVSTHSPYFVAMPDITHIRSLKKTPQGILTTKLNYSISPSEKKILAREILARRGEILFARALILCEGMTEEQIIPAMFEAFSGGNSLFMLGICCVSVGGKGYAPFVKLACSFGIPVFIVSDNDGSTKTEIENQIKKLKNEHLPLTTDNYGISFYGSTNDIEAELINVLKMRDEINEALVLYETDATDNPQYKAAKEKEIKALSDIDVLARMRDAKAAYSGFLADVIRQNPNNKQSSDLILQAALDAFNAIKGWIPT